MTICAVLLFVGAAFFALAPSGSPCIRAGFKVTMPMGETTPPSIPPSLPQHNMEEHLPQHNANSEATSEEHVDEKTKKLLQLQAEEGKMENTIRATEYVEEKTDAIATQELKVVLTNPGWDEWSQVVRENAAKYSWSLDLNGTMHAFPKWHVPAGIKVTRTRKCDSCDCSFLDEKMWQAKCDVEKSDRTLVANYLPHNATTLELGARYGTNACAISMVQGQSGKQVSVEADPRVWKALEINKQAHKCNFHIAKGLLGKKDGKIVLRGYSSSAFQAGTRLDTAWEGGDRNKIWWAQRNADQKHVYSQASKSVRVPHVTVADLENRYGLRFDALVLDCEGCAPYIFQDFPELADQLHTIIMEVHDEGEQAMVRTFEKRGWKVVYANPGRWRVVLKKIGFR